MHKFLLASLMFFCGWPLQSTEVYQWRDQNGEQHFSDRPAPGARIVTVDPGYALIPVEHVYDGDTVRLADGRKVRLLGINAPEVEGRTKTAEAGGEAAKRWLTEALKNRRVRLVRDVEKKDKYGRTLAYVFTEQKRNINLALVEAGLAVVSIFPPNLQYAEALTAAQAEAEAAGRGIWGRAEYAPKPVGQITAKHGKGWQRVVGIVTGLHNTRKYVHLIFSSRFDARIERKNLALFPDLKGYVGKNLEVRGWLNRSKDRFSMLIRHPSALKVLSNR